MPLTNEQSAVIADARQRHVAQVRVIFLDYNGLARARSVSLDALDGAFIRGINFSSPTVDFNSRELFPPESAFDLASPDVWALPDAATYGPAPAVTGVGQMLADLIDASENPWSGCPRTALRKVIRRAEEHGLVFQTGFEPEGYLFRHDSNGITFTGPAEFATLDGLDLHAEFVADLLAHLKDAGIDVDQWSEEYGPGQIEVNLRYGAALPSADAVTAYKHAFRAIARKSGFHGSFMPKPFWDQAGSGMHVHISAVTTDDPETNAFDDPVDGLGLSTVARHALAGMLRHGPALTALGASTVNSYKRFLPGSWAPTHVMYAYASRAAFIRIPERETARRLEIRIGDPACNPYIYLAGILAAALDGIENELDPGVPVPGDVGSAHDADAPRVPTTLEHALDELESDEVMHAALGPIILEEFVKVKRSEWDDFAMHVGAWDREWYLGRY